MVSPIPYPDPGPLTKLDLSLHTKSGYWMRGLIATSIKLCTVFYILKHLTTWILYRYFVASSLLQALNSIMKYPLPLTSGQEAKILDHVGMELDHVLYL